MGALTSRRVVAIGATITLLALFSWPAFAAGPRGRLDRALAARAGQAGTSRVIVSAAAGADVAPRVNALRGRLGNRLALVEGYVADVPNDALAALAADPAVAGVHLDRRIGALPWPG